MSWCEEGRGEREKQREKGREKKEEGKRKKKKERKRKGRRTRFLGKSLPIVSYNGEIGTSAQIAFEPWGIRLR